VCIWFWSDWWTGEGPLQLCYPRLFEISSNLGISVAQAHRVTDGLCGFGGCWRRRESPVASSVRGNWRHWPIKQSWPNFLGTRTFWPILNCLNLSEDVSGRHFAHVQDYLKCQDSSKKSHFFTWHLEKDRLPSSDNVGHADGGIFPCQPANWIFRTRLFSQLWRTLFSSKVKAL
jgi:hypothetical protein